MGVSFRTGVRQVRTFISIAAAFALLLPGAAKADGDKDAVFRALVGQMIVVGFEGASVNDPSFKALLKKVRAGHISGVLYLQRNLASGSAVTVMNEALQKAAPSPVLVAIDQEGGAIQRIPQKLGFPRVPAARTVAGRLSPREAFNAYAGLARALRSWGFNLNLGPVADLDVNPKNPIIGKLGRSFSSNPEVVVHYSAAFVDAHRKYGVLTSLKHFPGHGSATADSHAGFVDVTATSVPEELSVFKELIEDDSADLVMVGHTYDRKLQPRGRLPATLDGEVVTRLLRGKLGFQGAVITDDLQMEAVQAHFSLKDTVVKAVLAGGDLLVFGNSKTVDPDLDVKVTDIIVAEAKKDPNVRKAVMDAARRIARLKARLSDGLDGMSTRSINVSAQFVTPDFVRLQQRPTVLEPIF